MINIENSIELKPVQGTVSNLDSVSISHSILSILPYHIAIEYFALPLNIDSCSRLEALMAYPGHVETLQMYIGMTIKPISGAKE
jgi:hypothetical protein